MCGAVRGLAGGEVYAHALRSWILDLCLETRPKSSSMGSVPTPLRHFHPLVSGKPWEYLPYCLGSAANPRWVSGPRWLGTHVNQTGTQKWNIKHRRSAVN